LVFVVSGIILTKIGFNARLKASINDCILDILPEAYEHLINRYYRGLIKDLECRSGKVFLNGVEVSDINEVLKRTKAVVIEVNPISFHQASYILSKYSFKPARKLDYNILFVKK
jgi:hypothetical protein